MGRKGSIQKGGGGWERREGCRREKGVARKEKDREWRRGVGKKGSIERGGGG